MCCQRLRFTMSLIVGCLTPNASARSACFSPFAYLARIARTLAAVRMAPPERSPLAARFFASLSALFARWSPRNRWDGFTHAGVSQRWRTCAPGGSRPCTHSHDARWAYILRPVSSRMIPYPFVPSVLHRTHSPVRSASRNIFAKRTLNGVIGLPMCTMLAGAI